MCPSTIVDLFNFLNQIADYLRLDDKSVIGNDVRPARYVTQVFGDRSILPYFDNPMYSHEFRKDNFTAQSGCDHHRCN